TTSPCPGRQGSLAGRTGRARGASRARREGGTMAQAIHCQGCGQDAPLDSRFCPHCGRALAAAPAVWPTAPAGDGLRYSETAWFAEGERPPLPYVRPVNRIAWLLVISIFAAVMLVG